MSYLEVSEIELSHLLKELCFCTTTGDVQNALKGGSVRINNEVISNSKTLIVLSSEK